MTLSNFLKTYRAENGLSQRQLAKMIGVSNAYISLLEKDLNPKTGLPISVTIDRLRKIASGVGMTLQELFEVVEVDVDLSDVMQDPRVVEIRQILERLSSDDLDDLLALARAKAARYD